MSLREKLHAFLIEEMNVAGLEILCKNVFIRTKRDF